MWRCVMGDRVPRESRFEWYVMQVATGKERRMCELVRSIVPGEILRECFSPTYEVQKKVRGEWVRQSQLLFPGYLIVVTNQVERLGELLRAVPEFLRLLSVGETFVPLREDERA
jgi:transcriptional antiterminator NusG